MITTRTSARTRTLLKMALSTAAISGISIAIVVLGVLAAVAAAHFSRQQARVSDALLNAGPPMTSTAPPQRYVNSNAVRGGGGGGGGASAHRTSYV